jgi:hypothetical protein
MLQKHEEWVGGGARCGRGVGKGKVLVLTTKAYGGVIRGAKMAGKKQSEKGSLTDLECSWLRGWLRVAW